MLLSNAESMKMPNYPISNFGVRSVKSIVWLIFTVFFGLLLPIMLASVNVFFAEKSFPYEQYEQFVRNGSLMFFATAVATSVTLDYILSEKFSDNWSWNLFKILLIKNWNLLEILTLFVFPLLIFSACITLFYISHYQSEANIDLLWAIEFYILLATFFHGIIIKILAFK